MNTIDTLKKYLKKKHIGKEFFKSLTPAEQKELGKALTEKGEEVREFTLLLESQESLFDKLKASERKRKAFRIGIIAYGVFFVLALLCTILFSLFLFPEKQLLELFTPELDDDIEVTNGKYVALIANVCCILTPLNIFFLLPLFVYSIGTSIANRRRKKPIDLLDETILKLFSPCGINQGDVIRTEEIRRRLIKTAPRLEGVDIRAVGRTMKALGFRKNFKPGTGYLYHLKIKKRPWNIFKRK